MKPVLFLAALPLFFFTSLVAHATEDRIYVNEIHKLVERTEAAINARNIYVGRDILDKSFSDNAVFENRIATRNNYNQNASYYYGQATYAPRLHYQSGTKWQYISLLEQKKQTIPGYGVDFEATDINLRPYGNTAIIGLNIKEFTLAYSPYNANLIQKTLQTNSRCRAYISQTINKALKFDRIDCNTKSALGY